MKLFVTLPYDPNGIEVRDGWERDPSDKDWFTHTHCCGWEGHRLVEGETVHFTREAAVAKAREHRSNWITKTTQEAARVAALPQIAE